MAVRVIIAVLPSPPVGYHGGRRAEVTRIVYIIVYILAAVVATAACDGSAGSPPAVGMSGDPPPPRAAAAAADATGADGGAALPDALPEEVGTFELPRVQADPALTRKLVAGPVTVLGGDAGCSNGATAAGRWGPFTIRSAAGSDELWVMNATRALAGAPIACDGTSDSCLRLTTTLWTGTPIWGPSHPIAHRVAFDNLVFHAGATSAPGEVYAGPVRAWRPRSPAALKLTGDHALLCAPEARSSAVFCLDNAIVERDPGSPFE